MLLQKVSEHKTGPKRWALAYIHTITVACINFFGLHRDVTRSVTGA